MKRIIFCLSFLLIFLFFPQPSFAATSCAFSSSGGGQITLKNDRIPEGTNPFKLDFLLNPEGYKALKDKTVYLETGGGFRGDSGYSTHSKEIDSMGFSIIIDSNAIKPEKFTEKGRHQVAIHYTSPAPQKDWPYACQIEYWVYAPAPKADELDSEKYIACEDACPGEPITPGPLTKDLLSSRCEKEIDAFKKRFTCPNGAEPQEVKAGVCGCELDQASLPNATLVPGRSYGGGQPCNPDTGKLTPPDPPGTKTGVMTAIGCVPTEPRNFVNGMVQFISFASGGIALILMFFASWRWITAMGNQDSIKKAQDQFTNAFIGLLFILFSVLLMQIIGVDILAIPGFTA